MAQDFAKGKKRGGGKSTKGKRKTAGQSSRGGALRIYLAGLLSGVFVSVIGYLAMVPDPGAPPEPGTAGEVAQGRVATVAIDGMAFLTPVHVGAVVSCYTDVLEIGRSSIRMMVEVWINSKHDGEPIKVTEGEFVFVAIDENGRTRAVPVNAN